MTIAQALARKSFRYAVISGAVILLLYVLFTVDPDLRPGTQVLVTIGQQQRIAADFERTWQRKPNDPEMSDLLDAFVREEIAWREAMRLALGRDDADIRRRLQRQLESLAADEAIRVPPTREELQTFLNERADDFRVDPTLTFRQIYFDNTDNVIGADASARYMLGTLRNQDMPEDISTLGDPSSLPAIIDQLGGSEVGLLFGDEFAATLSAAPLGEWVGPIPSQQGLHLVYVDARVAGRIPVLDEIEDAVEEKWRTARRAVAIHDMYQRLAANYKVTIEQD
jgi:parvulin-like peptidyl-prolyl cis-trans isomerase-like protein